MAEHAVIGYVHDGNTRAEFTASLLALALAPEARTQLDAVIAWESGPNISTPRNTVVAKFLAGPTPWLLLADTDMVFAPDALDRLIAAADPAERPIVGGLCYQRNPDGGDPLPVLLELVETQGRLAFTRLTSWPDDACLRVSATGAAFLLIHRDALLAVEKAAGDTAAPWFRESDVGAPLSLLSEDLTFCLRAGAAGIPVHVHTGVRVGHMKTGMLGTVR